MVQIRHNPNNSMGMFLVLNQNGFDSVIHKRHKSSRHNSMGSDYSIYYILHFGTNHMLQRSLAPHRDKSIRLELMRVSRKEAHIRVSLRNPIQLYYYHSSFFLSFNVFLPIVLFHRTIKLPLKRVSIP